MHYLLSIVLALILYVDFFNNNNNNNNKIVIIIFFLNKTLLRNKIQILHVYGKNSEFL